ncbi:MAG TPA: nucleoside-diphosphate kinase [Candidatus Absconditabacterales bacterium]|nr:nucleoside-diphosphate kinase [Candidatus Absconditabacterales bacterium]
MGKIERTLVVLKPDAIGRSVIGDVISRFERAGLHIVAMKMVKPDAEFFKGHYEGIGQLGTRKGEKILNRVIDDMMATPVLAMVIEGVEVVEYVRKLVGPTEPKSAMPGTIRGDFAHISYAYVDNNPGASVYNLIHASADSSEAEQEIKHWFKPGEMFDYDPLHSNYTR